MKLKQALVYPFAKWYRPVGYFFFAWLLLMISMVVDFGLLSLLALIATVTSTVIIIVSLFVLLFRKRWREFFYTLVFIVVMVVNFGLLSGM